MIIIIGLAIALVIFSYLLGAAPHLKWLAKLRHVRLTGDFHRGLWEKGGKGVAVIGVLGEFVKGAAPVLAGRWLAFHPAVITLAGLAAVCGQMWPVFSRFDGEKGNSVAIAMEAALTPISALAALIFPLFALIVRTLPRLTAGSAEGDKKIIGGRYSRSLPLGMGLFFLAVPVFAALFGGPAEIVGGTAAVFFLLMLRRLTAGLRADLKTGVAKKQVLLQRLLYDRPTAAWRS